MHRGNFRRNIFSEFYSTFSLSAIIYRLLNWFAWMFAYLFSIITNWSVFCIPLTHPLLLLSDRSLSYILFCLARPNALCNSSIRYLESNNSSILFSRSSYYEITLLWARRNASIDLLFLLISHICTA